MKKINKSEKAAVIKVICVLLNNLSPFIYRIIFGVLRTDTSADFFGRKKCPEKIGKRSAGGLYIYGKSN